MTVCNEIQMSDRVETRKVTNKPIQLDMCNNNKNENNSKLKFAYDCSKKISNSNDLTFTAYFFTFNDVLYEKENMLLKTIEQNYVVCNCSAEFLTSQMHKEIYDCLTKSLVLYVTGDFEKTKSNIRKNITKCHKICFEISLYLYFYLIQSHIYIAEFLEAKYYIKKMLQIIYNHVCGIEEYIKSNITYYKIFYNSYNIFLDSLTKVADIDSFADIQTKINNEYKTSYNISKHLEYYKKYYSLMLKSQKSKIQYDVDDYKPDNNKKLYINIDYNNVICAEREVRTFDLPTKYKSNVSTTKMINTCLEEHIDYTFLSFYVYKDKLAINLYNIDNKYENIEHVNDAKMIQKNCNDSFDGKNNIKSETLYTEIDWNETKAIFDDLIAKSKETMLRNVKTTKEKIAWWKDRHILDKEMKKMCQKISKNIENTINNTLNKMQQSNTSEHCLCNKKHVINTNLYMNEKTYKKNIKSNIYNITDEDTKTYDKNDSNICKQLSNTKNNIKSNVYNITHKNTKTYDKNDNCNCKQLSNTKNNIKSNIYIITDEKTTIFPFEMLGILENKICYRTQSFEWLYTRITTKNTTNNTKNSIFYVLDPENNLEDTRNTIQKIFSDYALHCKKNNGITNKYDCEGIIGRAMTDEEMKNVYKMQFFMYFGHGNGEKYIKKENIKHMNNAVTFLFGCSSSKTSSHKNFKRNGICLEYMKNSKSFVGCLWDVTDKDLDKFSVAMIKDILYNNNKNLGSLVQKHKRKMKLKYLNGGAIVLWGIPLS